MNRILLWMEPLIKNVAAICALLYLAAFMVVLVFNLTSHRLYLLSIANMGAGLFVLTYWLQKQIGIEVHYFEWTEAAVLVIELLIVGFSVYHLFWYPVFSGLKVIVWTVFLLHFVLIAGLSVFLVFFRFSRMI